jgi:uncharacterized damage-inducible protein DinB
MAFVALLLIFAVSLGISTSAQPAGPKTLTYQDQVLANLEYTAGNLIALAEAIPAEEYSWRPAPGARSVSEVFMHVTNANYYLLAHMGSGRPEDLPRNSEKTITEKVQVVGWLKKSIADVKQAVSNTSDADLQKPVRLFNSDNNHQGVILQLVSHVHEHLGQSVAYARMMGVTPPWSQ